MALFTQDYEIVNVRDAAILTGSYVAGTVITGGTGTGVHLKNQLNLYVSFTIGSLTSCEIKVEFSADGTTYYQETFSAIGGGTSVESLGVHSLTATGNYRISIPLKDRLVKISAKGTGTVTNSSLAIKAVVGIA